MTVPRTVAFVTFGCRLNRAEALDLEAAYRADGWTVVTPADAPARIIVRGCSVTAKAERDCRKTIARLRREHPVSEILLTGCLENAPSQTQSTKLKTSNIELPTQRPPFQSTSRAYLKVQDGCSGRCTYCIVPHFRGAPQSVPFSDVLARARAFLDAGFREIVLTGCNLALYHSEGHTLPALLAALAEIAPRTQPPASGIPHQAPGTSSYRLRLGSIEPGICDEALLEVLAAHANVCPFLHLSLQSAAPRVLAAMRRPYAIEDVERFCAEARRRLGPRLMLGADVIAGFPGETEEDFELTRNFLARHGFAAVHAFPYSERPGTPAAAFPNRVPVAVRRARAKMLSDEGAHRKRAFAEALGGQEVEICVERDGRTGLTAEGIRLRLPASAPRRALVRTTLPLDCGEGN